MFSMGNNFHYFNSRFKCYLNQGDLLAVLDVSSVLKV